MSFIQCFMLFLIALTVIIYEYIQTKKLHKLWAIPLMAYAFMGLPILERFKLNVNELFIFIPVLIISLGFLYADLRNSKQQI